jgi:hypothetical protein
VSSKFNTIYSYESDVEDSMGGSLEESKDFNKGLVTSFRSGSGICAYDKFPVETSVEEILSTFWDDLEFVGLMATPWDKKPFPDTYTKLKSKSVDVYYYMEFGTNKFVYSHELSVDGEITKPRVFIEAFTEKDWQSLPDNVRSSCHIFP